MGEVRIFEVSPRRDVAEVLVGNIIIPFYRRGDSVKWSKDWHDRRKIDGRIWDRAELDVPGARFKEALRVAYATLFPPKRVPSRPPRLPRTTSGQLDLKFSNEK